MSSDQISSTQRSVLVSRFGDMVGSEGRGDGLVQVGAGKSLGVDTPGAAPDPAAQQSQQVAPETTGNMVDLEA